MYIIVGCYRSIVVYLYILGVFDNFKMFYVVIIKSIYLKILV